MTWNSSYFASTWASDCMSPYETSRKGYYNIPKFWDGIGWHFAIGYPF